MGSQRERMLSGSLYKADDDELVASRRACRRLLDAYNATLADDDGVRQQLLDELLGSFGEGSLILPRFVCDYGQNITIGAHTFVNYDSIMLDCAHITIGDYVSIGPRVQLLTARHPVDDHEARRSGWEAASPIAIGDNAWIGAGAVVCPGVRVGDNSVVGAGSIVTENVAAHVVAAGNPCRILRAIP